MVNYSPMPCNGDFKKFFKLFFRKRLSFRGTLHNVNPSAGKRKLMPGTRCGDDSLESAEHVLIVLLPEIFSSHGELFTHAV